MRKGLLIALIATALTAGALAASATAGNGAQNGNFNDNASANGRIAFSSDRSGVFAIWTINPDGTGATQLTQHDTTIQDWWPVVSPDGQRIAFTRYDGPPGPGTSEAIYIMNADGSNLQRLSNVGNNVDDNLADFSPDGRKIAFISDRNDPNPKNNCRPQAIGAPGCNWEIYVMNTDGTDQQRLTNTSAGVANTYPEFSPNGQKLLFASTRSGSSALYTTNRHGSDVQKLTPDSLGAGDANWSPDGTKVTFVWQFEANDNEIFTINADGTGVTQLTNYGTHPTLEPEYSPDGTKILFDLFGVFPPTATNCCGNGDLVVMSSIDGSGKTNITNMAPAIDSETADWGPAVGGPEQRGHQ
ncbi:MAG: TolB family protein [Solirubrobacteraceae bacterium]